MSARLDSTGTWVGVRGADGRARVDDRGRIELGPGRPTLGWAVLAGERWSVPGEAATRQTLVDDAPVVETRLRAGGGDAVHRVWVVPGPPPTLVIEVLDDGPGPGGGGGAGGWGGGRRRRRSVGRRRRRPVAGRPGAAGPPAGGRRRPRRSRGGVAAGARRPDAGHGAARPWSRPARRGLPPLPTATPWPGASPPRPRPAPDWSSRPADWPRRWPGPDGACSWPRGPTGSRPTPSTGLTPPPTRWSPTHCQCLGHATAAASGLAHLAADHGADRAVLSAAAHHVGRHDDRALARALVDVVAEALAGPVDGRVAAAAAVLLAAGGQAAGGRRRQPSRRRPAPAPAAVAWRPRHRRCGRRGRCSVGRRRRLRAGRRRVAGGRRRGQRRRDAGTRPRRGGVSPSRCTICPPRPGPSRTRCAGTASTPRCSGTSPPTPVARRLRLTASGLAPGWVGEGGRGEALVR